ncbi:MAG: sigma-70 family RNA polymerase sigma factor [Myxococcota bacterium]
MPDRSREDTEARRAWIQAALAQHERALTVYATRLLGELERARDVVQETFLRLWEADRQEVGDHVAAWLFTVCRHRALDVLKKERRMLPVPNPRPAHPPDSGQTPFDAVLQEERQGLALKALERLPERQRELVRLKFQAGLSYDEIARVTGLTTSNVGYLLHTALKAVRSHLGSES